MKTKLVAIGLLLLFTGIANAQNARAILDKANEAYSKMGAISAKFTLETKDKKAKTSTIYDGKALMKGEKFKLEVPEGITWFDGKTQWVYMEDTEEVNVTNPTAEELRDISPAALFGIYKSGFDLVTKPAQTVNGKSANVVEMIPQKKNTDISKIIVCVDKSNHAFSKITIENKSGIQNILTIKSFETAKLPEETFTFNKKEFPRAEVVDLR